MNDEQHETPPLPADKLQAVVMLVEGKPKTRIAESLGITRDTLYQWLKHPDFQRALQIQQRRMAEVVTDPTAYTAGLVAWKAQLTEMMAALMETARDPKNPKQTRAAELILKAVTPDKLNTGPTDDEKIIQKWLEQNGIAAHPAMKKAKAE